MTQTPTAISLFAGAGGMDLGLEAAGFVTHLATDVDANACETLRLNRKLGLLDRAEVEHFIDEIQTQRCYLSLDSEQKFRAFERLRRRSSAVDHLRKARILQADIRAVSSEVLSESVGGTTPTLVAGGPPCQPFSRAGKRESLDCTKNGDLFYEFVRVVRDLRPKWFLFENVKGLTFTKTDVVYVHCAACTRKAVAPFSIRQKFVEAPEAPPPCLECGSSNTSWVVKSERGGSEHIIRNEFEALGYRCYSTVLNSANFGIPQTRERFFIVGSRDGLDFAWPQATHCPPASSQLPLFDFAASKRNWVGIGDALWKSGHPTFGQLDPEQAVLWVKNVVRPHDEPVTWSLSRPSPTIGAHQAAKLAIAPFGVPEEQLLRQQWATRGRKQGDTPPVQVVHEYLSDEELLRLQTFPSYWYLHGTRMQRAFQIGNAVPPKLAEAIAQAILNADRAEGLQDPTSLTAPAQPSRLRAIG